MQAGHVGLNLAFLAPGATGGSETYARALVPALREVRPDLRITALAATELADELEAEPWVPGLEVVRLPVSARTRVQRVLVEQTAVPLAARRAGVDVLHSLASTSPIIAPGPAKVVTILDLIYATHPETHAGFLRHGMAMLVPAGARTSHRVVAISRYTASELVARLALSEERIAVVPIGPGVEPDVAPTPASELRGRFGLADAPIVLSVSARRPHKNLERLIDAMRLLPEPAVLVLPGYPGPHDAALAQRGGDRVRLLGWVSDADLEGLYAAAACLAFPSLAEGFGLPVLEAMRRGVPVACSDATALPEIAGDAALLFDPLSVDAISDAVGRLLRDPDLREDLAGRGRARAATFSWRRTAEGTLEAYDEALQIARARRAPRRRR